MAQDNPIEWINHIPIRRFTREWIIEEANKKGRKVAHCAGLMLDKLAQDEAAGYDTNGCAIWAYDNFMEGQRNKIRARTVARLYQDDPSDEKLEWLKIICKRASISIDEAIAGAEADPFSAMAARRSADTALGGCIEWLTDLMMHYPDGVDSSVVIATANEKGFSGSTLGRAKQTINMDSTTPTIDSKKIGKGWIWVVRTDAD